MSSPRNSVDLELQLLTRSSSSYGRNNNKVRKRNNDKVRNSHYLLKMAEQARSTLLEDVLFSILFTNTYYFTNFFVFSHYDEYIINIYEGPRP